PARCATSAAQARVVLGEHLLQAAATHRRIPRRDAPALLFLVLLVLADRGARLITEKNVRHSLNVGFHVERARAAKCLRHVFCPRMRNYGARLELRSKICDCRRDPRAQALHLALVGTLRAALRRWVLVQI